MSDDVRDGLARAIRDAYAADIIPADTLLSDEGWSGLVGAVEEWHPEADAALAYLAARPAVDVEAVATPEELDALPVGSVVRVEDDASVGVWLKVANPHERWMGVEVDREDGWPSVEGAQHWLSDALPARVLYRPAAEQIAALTPDVTR